MRPPAPPHVALKRGLRLRKTTSKADWAVSRSACRRRAPRCSCPCSSSLDLHRYLTPTDLAFAAVYAAILCILVYPRHRGACTVLRTRCCRPRCLRGGDAQPVASCSAQWHLAGVGSTSHINIAPGSFLLVANVIRLALAMFLDGWHDRAHLAPAVSRATALVIKPHPLRRVKSRTWKSPLLTRPPIGLNLFVMSATPSSRCTSGPAAPFYPCAPRSCSSPTSPPSPSSSSSGRKGHSHYEHGHTRRPTPEAARAAPPSPRHSGLRGEPAPRAIPRLSSSAPYLILDAGHRAPSTPHTLRAPLALRHDRPDRRAGDMPSSPTPRSAATRCS